MAMKIIEVATRSPFCKMWLYSRSWRIPTIEPLLRAMAALLNLVVYYSCDADTGLPEVVPPGVRIAWMETVGDAPPVDQFIDLLFRDYPLRKERVPLHMADVVCPSETVEGKDRGVTCATCARCFVK